MIGLNISMAGNSIQLDCWEKISWYNHIKNSNKNCCKDILQIPKGHKSVLKEKKTPPFSSSRSWLVLDVIYVVLRRQQQYKNNHHNLGKIALPPLRITFLFWVLTAENCQLLQSVPRLHTSLSFQSISQNKQYSSLYRIVKLAPCHTYFWATWTATFSSNLLQQVKFS